MSDASSDISKVGVLSKERQWPILVQSDLEASDSDTITCLILKAVSKFHIQDSNSGNGENFKVVVAVLARRN